MIGLPVVGLVFGRAAKVSITGRYTSFLARSAFDMMTGAYLGAVRRMKRFFLPLLQLLLHHFIPSTQPLNYRRDS